MAKITKKLIKYFILIITIIVIILFITSNIFMSFIYTEMQYNSLETSAKNAYAELKKSDTINTSTPTILYKNGNSHFLTSSLGMGKMNFFMNLKFDSLNQKGTLKNPMGDEFLYYKLNTELGYIITIENNKFSLKYLHITYLVLLIVFFLGILISIPIVSYIGKQFTKPILQLQNATLEIANGNLNTNILVNTNDEIEELSKSIENMAINLDKKHKLQQDFIANVSHDFKTPLSIIRNYTEAILDGIVDEEDKNDYSKQIISEVDRLNGLVTDLLNLSKFKNNGFRLNKDTINIKDLIEDYLDKLKPLAIKKNIELSVHFFNISNNLFVSLDPTQIYRVIYNFIDNAIKFSNDYGIIEVCCALNAKIIKISVTDHGIGIEPHMLEDIWIRYYKHSTSGGMGLGLAICSEILKLHNFNYGVTSSTEEGTTFYFEIAVSK